MKLHIERDRHDPDAVENTAEFLIQKGVDINAVGEDGETALIKFTRMGNFLSLVISAVFIV